MDLRELLHLDRIQGGRGPERPAGTDPKKFQNLLDELQKISSDRASSGQPSDSADSTDTDGTTESTDLREFADELRRADRDYATLMDLRQQLEEAFRRRTP